MCLPKTRWSAGKSLRVAHKWHLSSVAAWRVNVLFSWSLKWGGCWCSLQEVSTSEGFINIASCQLLWWMSVNSGHSNSSVLKAEALLLLRGLHSSKRLQAFFSLQGNSSKIKFVLEYSACGKCVASFLDSAGEEICLPVWFSECAYCKCLNATEPSNTLSFLLGLQMDVSCVLNCSPWSYRCIALWDKLSRETVVLMVSILEVCRADCVLRFAGSTEEGFQVLGTGPQTFWQHQCTHQEYVLLLLMLMQLPELGL